MARGKLTSSSALVIAQYLSLICFVACSGIWLPQKTLREVSMLRKRAVCMMGLPEGSRREASSHFAKCLRVMASWITRYILGMFLNGYLVGGGQKTESTNQKL